MSWSTSELRVRLAPLNRFKSSSKVFYWPIQGGTSFVDLLCFFLSCVCFVFVRVCLYVLCGHLLGKGWPLGSRLWCLTVSLSFPLVSWVRCGTWLYRFLIFAPLLTLWSPAGKWLTSWLSFVVSLWLVTFPLVSWDRYGTWLYRFLIFAPLLTFTQYRYSLFWSNGANGSDVSYRTSVNK